MIALDTNILVRFALNDNPVLSPLARDLIEHNECHVCLLALTELGFVLASVYGATSKQIVSQVQRLLAIPTLHFEHEARLPAAMAGVVAGIDWFDAMLWAASDPCALVTFDREFARRAGRLGWHPPVVSKLPARAGRRTGLEQ